MKLDQFIKWSGWVSTGGEAKRQIQSRHVSVNGSIETCRGRQLTSGDIVLFGAYRAVVGENVA